MNKNFLAVLLAATLAACGGGGGGSSTGSTGGSTNNGGGSGSQGTGATGTTNTQPTQPATYPSGSEQAAAYDLLNQLRGTAPSIGVLTQNPILDTSALKHATYLVANSYQNNATYLASATSDSGTHLGAYWEGFADKSFYAPTVGDRAQLAGIKIGTYVTEAVVANASTLSDCVRKALNSVYQREALLYPNREVGLARVVAADGSSACVIDGATTTLTDPNATAQYLADNQVAVYPVNGQTNVPTTFTDYLSPVPDVQVPGSPISIMCGYDPMTVQTFTVVSDSGESVQGRLMVQGNPNPQYMNTAVSPTFVHFIPLTELAPGTKYTVTFKGTMGGASLSLQSTFTTAAVKSSVSGVLY